MSHSRTRTLRGTPLRIRDMLGTTARFDHTFTYDKNANITQIVDGVTGNQENRFLVYDDRDRMTNADAPNMYGAEFFEFDPLDNVRRSALSFTGGNTYAVDYRYVYDGNQRLDRIDNAASLTQWDYTLNGFGETTQRNNVAGGTSWAYTWNAAGRMTQAGTESYVYDAHGHRTKATRTGPASTRYQIYTRSGQLVYAEDTRDNQRIDFIHLAGRLVAQRSRPIATTTATTTYHHVDGIGSASVETDQFGAIVNRTIRTPWGQPYDGTYREGPGYAGHVTDKTTGLTYMQQRYYDPIALRFLSTDPVDVSGANGSNFNRYWYADNNPLKHTDPDGRVAQAIWGAPIGAITSIAVQMATADGSFSERFDKVSWGQVGLATVAGAASGGVSAIASTAATTGGVITANVIGNAGVGALSAHVSAQIEGETASVADVATGALTSGAFAGAGAAISAAPKIAAQNATAAMSQTERTATANLLGGVKNATPNFQYSSPVQTAANAAGSAVSSAPDLQPLIEEQQQ